MDLADAARLAAHLKAAYPRMTLDEAEGELFVHEIARLSDVTAALAAADRIIRTSDRFPTVAEFREQYRAMMPRYPELPEPPPGDTAIPEWVQVWFWHMQVSRGDRQKRNETSRQPVDERPPVKMRDFPQFSHPGPDAYTMAEYEAIKARWVEAGSPAVSTTSEIFAAVG